MKLWDVLATCLLLLSSVSTRPLFHKSRRAVRYGETTALDPFLHARPESSEQTVEDQYEVSGPDPEQFHKVMDFIQATMGRLRRSSDSEAPAPTKRGRQKGAIKKEQQQLRGRGDRKRGRGRGAKDSREDRVKGQGRGCLLREVHLNVTDLGLGYRTKEELIFRYCSGPCHDAETNYDKILNNLTHHRKLDKDTPARTCCRPIAFDDDISFLDDDLEYHTLKKHSAKKCGCV